ncbi:MAG: hypothetical protein M0016_01240 [Deltaproteobacteria bacterium]|jgi:hypothetical protein|nr:hypothetical protein [Deltaproteobacteria bacterium]MCL5880842.1 hypothetical protein [Deltaproteobacteria bacterium]MDA8303774.1 hypothetical protein [Deltaproteobacteria bacterium]
MTSSTRGKDTGKCRTTDKKLAEQIEISVKNDIIKRENGLPSDKNKRLLFLTAWENYLKNIAGSNTRKTIERKKNSGRHAFPSNFRKQEIIGYIYP